jgi:hypothetical protein
MSEQNVPDALALPEEKRAYSAPKRVWFLRYGIWILGLVLTALVVTRITLYSGYVARDRNSAIRFVDEFHERINAGKYEQIYEDTDEGLNDMTSLESMESTMQTLGERFGKFKDVSESAITVNFIGPYQPRVICHSVFERGDVTETFEFLKEGDKLQLLRYWAMPRMAK